MKNLKIIFLIVLTLIASFFLWDNPFFIPSKNISALSQLEKSSKETTFKLGVQEQISGKQLFVQNCAVCHGKNLMGKPPSIPSLVDVSKRIDLDSIMNILKNGRNAMPSFSNLPVEQRHAIASYLNGKESNVKVKPLSLLQKGEQLFKSNCALCHKTVSQDPQPPGQRNYGMRPPILGGINRFLSFERFEQILNRGPFYMPSFTEISTEDKKAIYTYLSSLPYSGTKLNGCRGSKCGMDRKYKRGKCK